MLSKKFSGVFESLADSSDFIVRKAEAAGLNDTDVYSVQLAVDEACTNIIEHAYGGEGIGDITIACKITDAGLEIMIKDQGDVFDPSDVPDLDATLPLSEVTSRGAGIFLMRKLMDEVGYDFENKECTVLKMRKNKSG